MTPWRWGLTALLCLPLLAGVRAADPAPARRDDAAAAAALQLRYTTVSLPNAVEGQPYGPRLLVSGGRGPYRVAVVRGSLPAGLALTPEGMLSGTPKPGGPRSHGFVLEVSDAATPPQVLRQAYAIYVAPPRRAPPVVAAPAPASAPTFGQSADDASKLSRDIDEVWIYQLTEEKLGKVLKAHAARQQALALTAAAAAAPASAAASDAETEGDELPFSAEELQTGLKLLGLPAGRLPADAASFPEAAADAAEPAPAVGVAELQRMLKPLLDTEYPTRALFEAALRAARCATWREWLDKASAQEPRLKGLDCRRVGRTPPPPLPPPGQWSARSLHDALLPPALLAALLQEAERPIELSKAKGLSWKEADCGCVRRLPDDLITTLLPFWQASDKAAPVDFSAFSRIQLLGAALQDSGELRFPNHWARDIKAFAHQAQRHDARLELVIYRRDWTSLLSLPALEQQRRVPLIVERLLRELQQPALRPWPRPLITAWDEDRHVFDGLTLWFEDSPREPAQAQAFHRFYRELVNQLAQRMRLLKRPLSLNLVVPAERLGQPGAYRFEDLIAYVEGRQAVDTPPPLPRTYQPEPSSLSVHLLVLTPEPTTSSKKELRALFDRTTLVGGRRRVNLLEQVMPLTLAPAHPAQGAFEKGEQIDDDLAYYQWVFGGIALWPMPRASGGGDPLLLQRLRENYPGQVHWTSKLRLCDWICPNRELVRLLLELALLGCGGSLLLVLFTDLAQNRGRWMRLLLLLPLLLAAAIGFGLLNCDPRWLALREGNLPLAVLVVAILVALLGLAFRRRVPPP